MPNTCDKKLISNLEFRQKACDKIPNVINMMLSPVNIEMLRSWTLQSIEHIRTVYFDGQHTTETNRLRCHVMNMPHTRLLVVFFAMLNIDQDLKQRVMMVDEDKNARKLARFFMDLKHCAVSRFFATENITPTRFVMLCEELYVLA